MPLSAPARCTRCGQLARGRCSCQTGWAQPSPGWTNPDGTRKGGTRAWREVRDRRLAVNPYCASCGAPADTVDHLDGTDYRDDSGRGPSWLNIDTTRSLCTPCHRQRTGRQGRQAQG